MAQVQDVYVILTRDYKLLDKDDKGGADKAVVMLFDEDEARRALGYIMNSLIFECDLLQYNRSISKNGDIVTYTSRDPKDDGHIFRIWYEKRQMVLI